MLTTKDFWERVKEISSIENEPNEGFFESLDWVVSWYKENRSSFYPYLYPSLETGIRLEWPFDEEEVSLDFTLNPFSYHLHDSREFDTFSHFEMTNDDNFECLAEILNHYSNKRRSENASL